MKKIYLFLTLCCLSIAGYAQTAASYAFTNSSGTFTSIVGGTGTTAITSGGMISDDGGTTGIPIGFTFAFCGSNYTTCAADANGVLSLAGNIASYIVSTGNISGTGWLMPLWRDGYGGTTGGSATAYYQTAGAVGSRIFTMEWLNWSVCCSYGTATMNFQVKLFEGSNKVQFVYGAGSGSLPTNAVLGIANSGSDLQSLPTATSTTTNTTLNSTCSFPASGTILQFCPPAAVPSVPSGNAPICAGSAITLTDASGAGTWSSATTSVATIGSSSGTLTGIALAGGTSLITFTWSATGCISTVVGTVNASPAVPTGNAPVCPGGTFTLTDATGAGTWVSGSPVVATVNSSTGVVTGVATGGGTSLITFTLTSTGCTNTVVVTVNPLPAPPGGTLTACPGTTATVTDASGAGTWFSSGGAATIVGSTGVATGVSVGTSTISFTLTSTGCSNSSVFTVNPLPAAIGGGTTVCVGLSTTLTDASGSGTWSTVSSGASVGASTGLLTGITAGTSVITYTLPTGCQATVVATVIANAPITGSPSVCNGSTTTLSDAVTGGGTWNSTNPTVATVNSSGVVSSVSIGTATISFTATATGCISTFVVNVTPPPSSFTVTGGGAYCPGGSVPIGVNASNTGVTYYLYNGATQVATVPGSITGGSITFGTLAWPAGTYTVIANFGTPCANTMLGSAVVVVNPLPTAFAVTGGGTYCVGGTGVTVGLASSTIGVNYQLYVAGAPVGAPVAGTSGALNFGLQTTAGAYTVIATNGSTFCVGPMTGSVTVGTSPLPTAFSVTSVPGGYCAGGPGVVVGLSGSSTGVNYSLLLGGGPTGVVVAGTGSSISFGAQFSGGTYTVRATNTTTSCTNIMSGSAVITVNPLPTPFIINTSGGLGGGVYCAGSTGVNIGLGGSQSGISYQLMMGGTPAGSPVAGTGTSISFGLQTTTGSYTVVATNTTTSCTNNMTGSIDVATSPLPFAYAVTGGGGYCAGGVGVPVGVGASNAGINYQLFKSGSLVGAASGTGSAISFGNQTAAGVYSVVGANATTGCSSNMSGSVTVTINPLPTIFSVTLTGTGSYCAGGTGVVIGLNGSTTGVNYQLMNGVSPIGGVVAGTGSAISFGAQTIAGSYTVVAVNATTSCTSNMAGSALVTINPLPTVYTMTGGGGYCSGGAGVNIGLSSSNTGITYQLYSAAGAVGLPLTGTGSALSFGLQTITSARDSVVATNASTGCSSIMSGNVPVFINPLPAVFSTTGSGSYCSGGTGLTVNLGGSVSGVSYQLFNSGTPVGAPIAGTGSPLVFGPLTGGGTYTIAATNASTSCTSNMAGAATIVVNPLPAVFSVTGGGTYCAGSAAPHVTLSSSVSGINYQLYNGALPVGGLVPGTGLALDLGAQTIAGTYTAVAITPVTFCQSNMSGSANISINTVPASYTITQSAGSYCAGGAGIQIGLSNSAVGVSYQLFTSGTPSGAPVLGTVGSIDFGIRTAGGSYTAVATNMATGCIATMTGTAVIVVNALPAAQTMNGGGSYCPGGTGVVVGLASSNTGISYQLYNGSTPMGSPVTGTGLPVSFGLQTAAGSYTVVATNTTTSCTSNMPGSETVSISLPPTVYNITGGGNYCIGGTGVNIGLSGSSTGVLYQLFDVSAPMGAPIAGTGLPITFGLQTTTGNYTVLAGNVSSTCASTMAGSVNVGTNPLPTAYNVTGGGNYCAGGTGVTVGTDGSAIGTVYHLFIGGTPSGSPVAGTGGPLSFGIQTTGDVYTVIATNTATTCSNTLTGSATVGINTLPVAFIVGGGGNYCSGSGGSAVTLSGSDPAATYQLYNGATPVGFALPGSGAPLNFGLQTATGTYTVMSTSSANSCTSMMTGSVHIGINTLPTPFIVSGGGNYCAGGAGVHITLSGSNTGVSYRVFVGGTPMGAARAGTGTGLDFGAWVPAGAYTIVATNTSTGCTNNMLGTVMVGINPLPSVYTAATTSSSYCAGGTGVDISLEGSDAGISYQLYNGPLAIGAALAGTGTTIDFGSVTPTGIYTINARNTITGCAINMSPSINVTIASLPNVFTVTGGGHYCAGGTGVHIGLANSNAGISYQLYTGGLPAGAPVTGTGSAITFGLTTAGGTYTAIATNSATGCTNTMAGTAAVVVDPLPAVHIFTGGGNYCAGGTGVELDLSGSSVGISYQLMNGGVAAGSAVPGTGTAISFGMLTDAGTYTVKAVSSITGCSAVMPGAAMIAINPAPTAYPVTGGGNYCPGGTGSDVALSASNTNITYQLFNGATSTGPGLSGATGAGVDFGPQTAAGTYSVVGTDNTTGCSTMMTGTAIVMINALPNVHSVVGGGSYCSGGSGVHIGLAASDAGINYSLSDTTIAAGTLAGTGGPLDFGFQTIGGIYTIKATSATTGCSVFMSGSAIVTVNPMVAPTVSISSTAIGDTTCSGTFITFTAAATNGGSAPGYLWTVNGVTVGTGTTSYGYIPVNGDVVSVTLTSNQTCAVPTTANSSIVMTALVKETPMVTASADPGTEVCDGTVVTYTAAGTYGGDAPTFTWVKNSTAVGSSATFSYAPANNDNIYCIMGSNYRCRLANSATSSPIHMTVDEPVLPVVTITADPGVNVAEGQIVTLTASVLNGGPTPSFMWLVNGAAASGATGNTFSSGSFVNLDSITCQVTSSGGCSGLLGFNSITLHVANVGVKPVSFAGSSLTLIPNPNNGQFTLKGNVAAGVDEEVTLEVVNMLGQVIYNQKVTVRNGEINEHVQLATSLANGMYLLNLRSGTDNKVFHFVIEQ